jgi:uncharacterized protein YcbK (DUF882 family)
LKKQPKQRFVVRREPKLRARVATVILGLVATIGLVQFFYPGTALGTPFGGAKAPALAAPSSNAFGRSREVKLLFSLPGDRIEFPLSVGGDPAALSYEWTSLRGNESGFVTRPMAGAALATPDSAGFYYLTLVNKGERQILQEPIVVVMQPFQAKEGGLLNGYRIGTYLAEKVRGRDKETPAGFVEVYPQYLDIPVSKNLRLHHFVTHDEQREVWPKYVALNPRLLDKLELVYLELERMAGATPQPIEMDVNSGYRTPAHNRLVRRAASDSRHQYGDAADVVIDANGNGRIDREDHRLVAAAVETVEKRHTDLAGGMGIYTSPLYPTPYVHIDARGQKVRWRG